MDLEKLSPSVRYCFKEDPTQFIFHIDDLEVHFQDIGDSGSKDDELKIFKTHDDSEVRLPNCEAIFEKR